jgi:hypothetical protein
MTVNKKKTNQRPSAIQDVFMRLGILGEILSFLWKRKLYWLIPLVVTLLVFALLIVAGSSGPLGPFIYTMF